ncbi:MAG: hypothetical protein ABI367_03905 [Mucilaginibacter sp.]
MLSTTKQNLLYILLISIACIYYGCNTKYQQPDLHKVTFKPVWGIHFIEVKRRHSTGRSVDKYGYVVEPTWKMTFLSDDSASVYSPQKNGFATFKITNDHDSIFFVARTWLRAKKLTKDSAVFQVMDVGTNVIYLVRSTVYMTFYADDYIKNVLKTTPANLQKPDRQDTLFVKKMSAQANTHIDSVFAAREPVVLKSKSPYVTVEKVKVIGDEQNRYSTTDAYMYPEYNIKIKHAYTDFYYSFTIKVDDKGQMHFDKSLMPDIEKSYPQTMKAIMDGYLRAYLDITPGNTFGITHTSRITVNVYGSKKG